MAAFNAARVVALASFLVALRGGGGGQGGAWLCAAWCACECLALAGVRFAEDSWLFFDESFGAWHSGALHVAYYAAASMAPLGFLRLPFFLGGHVWAGAVAWTLVSNALMVAAAFHGVAPAAAAAAGAPGGGQWLTEDRAWALLAGCTAACAAGFAAMWASMVPAFRGTYWRKHTAADHAARLWEACTLRPEEVASGRLLNFFTEPHAFDRNWSRAFVLEIYRPEYWPSRAKLQSWVHSNWAAWQESAEQPPWLSPLLARMRRSGGGFGGFLDMLEREFGTSSPKKAKENSGDEHFWIDATRKPKGSRMAWEAGAGGKPPAASPPVAELRRANATSAGKIASTPMVRRKPKGSRVGRRLSVDQLAFSGFNDTV